MANYVLVHGGDISTETWNKLTKRKDYPTGGRLGGAVWQSIVIALEAKQHKVFAPTLADENTHNLSDHIKQIIDLIISNDLQKVILVGHSYGGMIITGVAAKIADRIAHLVYLDAALPEAGQSLFDLLALGGYKPEHIVGGTPPAYTEKMNYNAKPLETLDKIYITCTKSEFSRVIQHFLPQIKTSHKNWRFRELPTGHIPQATMPDELAAILLEIGEQA